MDRRNRWTAIACITLTALALVAGAAAAQEKPDPYTYVAEWTIARDQWGGYAEWAAKNTRPVLERLAADGTLLDWGIYETYIHTPDANTHGIWWSASSFAGIEKARVELLKSPFHPAAAAGMHRDYLLRAMFAGGKSGTVAGGFLYVNVQEVRLGHEAEWAKLWEKHSKPVLDELVAKGVLASYAVHVEDVHNSPISLRYIVTVSHSAAAEDQVEAAFTAASAKRSEAERTELRQAMRESTVPENHRDYLARIAAGWVK